MPTMKQRFGLKTYPNRIRQYGDLGPLKNRLHFNYNISKTSPVVRGTWVTVDHIVSMIVGGWTWGDILWAYPELTEDDIRVCLSYSRHRF